MADRSDLTVTVCDNPVCFRANMSDDEMNIDDGEQVAFSASKIPLTSG